MTLTDALTFAALAAAAALVMAKPARAAAPPPPNVAAPRMRVALPAGAGSEWTSIASEQYREDVGRQVAADPWFWAR
jgi:hypothetical protein